MAHPVLPQMVPGAITSRRQTDIKVPLFTPPYTTSQPVNNALFLPNSFSPAIIQDLVLSNGNVTTATFDALGPFASGRTILNPANAPGTRGSPPGKYILIGSTLVGIQTMPNNFSNIFKVPLISGVNFNLASSSQIFWDPNTVYPAPGSGASGGLGAGAQTIAVAMVKKILGVPQIWVGVVGPAPSFNDAILQPFYGGSVATAQYIYGFGTPAGSSVWQPTNVIPDILRSTNWAFYKPNNNKYYVGEFNLDGGNINANLLSFDDATIDSKVNGGLIGVQSTPYGFLIQASSTFLGTQDLFLLLSRDGSQYAVIQFAPRSALASANMPVGGTLSSGAIAPDGTFYLQSRTDATRIYNSFALNLSWGSVLLPQLYAPVNAIPELCGCLPFQVGVNKL